MGMNKRWNRLADAFAGRGAIPPQPEYPEVSLKEMADTLAGFTEETWGGYAFSREPLEGKFTPAQKAEYTAKANACGQQWAERMAEVYGTRSPRLLAERMGMKIEMTQRPVGGGLVLFAQFVQPNEITIFTDCIQRAAKLNEGIGCPLLQKELLTDTLLAHELFHGVEERYETEIYTRTEKVELWRKPFSNRSSIACLSEIGAMAFAAQLLGLSASPYMLDVLLVYSYDKQAALGLFQEICRISDPINQTSRKRGY
ncbi:MAG: hypothetical protein Q4F76_10150 [Lachnospiraceae bacterium]|nr:hypothetical protein [Lachnospiraceae bacterium]